MQTCATFDTTSVVSPDYITKRFMVLSELGSGIDGLIIKVLDTENNEVVALKSRIFLGNETDEIKIGCMLDPTRPFTHSLIMPQQWAIVSKNVFLNGSNPLLPNWIEEYEDPNDPRIVDSKGLVFTMPIMDYTLKEKYNTLTDDEERDILFELIVALEALRKIGIVHNDIHHRNILLKHTQELRSYTINGIQYIVTSQYMPVIIDFGRANIVAALSYNAYENDWIKMSDMFKGNIPREVEILLSKTGISVLTHDFFQPLRDRIVQPESLVRVFSPLI